MRDMRGMRELPVCRLGGLGRIGFKRSAATSMLSHAGRLVARRGFVLVVEQSLQSANAKSDCERPTDEAGSRLNDRRRSVAVELRRR